MKLTCKKCRTVLEIPEDATQTPGARVICPGCQARYRLRPRKTATAKAPRPRISSTQPPTQPALPPRHHSLTPATPMPTAVPTPSVLGDPETVVSTRPTARGLPVFEEGDLAAGRYRILRFLASGGMGEVYEAEDLELRQRLALKTISAHTGVTDGSAVDRFKREIALARTVTHPNVCRIFDLGQHQPPAPAEGMAPPAVTFLTMELLEGETLSDCLKRRGRLKTREALPLVEQMAAALGAAHQAQIVHRDFKSENVFLVPERAAAPRKRVVVTDFGVARGGTGDRFAAQVTGAGIVGTPSYMAPEQVEGGAITPATDIYSLGIVMYEMVTGRLPFEGANPLTTAVKRLKEPPPPPHAHVPDLEAWWEKAILKCLERDPAQRFASTDQLVAALQPPVRPGPLPLPSIQPGPPEVAAAPPPDAKAAPRPARRAAPPSSAAAAPAGNRRGLMLALILLLVSAASAALFVFNRDRELDRSRVTPRRSIAVVGLNNLTGDDDVAWLGTALAEMLTTELARGEALRTIPGENVAGMHRQLELTPGASLTRDDLERVRSLLGCDFLVSGSYVTLGTGAREIRLDLRLMDAALGTQVASVARDGRQEELFAMVAELGAELRSQLGVDEAGSSDDPLAGLPAEPEAARLYAEALDKLRDSQPHAARELLEQAARRAPENALVHSALSQAWEAEGFGARAAQSARRAFELSSPLPREDRLAVEGRYRETTGDWPAAIEVYRNLSEYFPDDLEYGLRLVEAQVSARDARGALLTLEDLRRLPAPISEDPRIDLAEAAAAGLESSFDRQIDAARRAAERAATMDAGLLVARARLIESQAQRALGQLAAAETAASEAHDLYAGLDHPTGTAQALTALANVYFDRGELDDAADRYRRVIDDYRRLGDQSGTASGLNNLAMVLRKRGDLDAAQSLYEEAATIFENTGDNLARSFALNNLGVLLVARDRLAEAGRMFESSRAIWEQLGNRSGLAYSLNNIAAVRHLTGDLGESRTLHEQALQIRRETGEKGGEATSLTNLADVLRDLGELEQAESSLRRALQLTEEVGDRSARAQALHGLGKVQLDRGAFEAARESHRQALDLRRELAESRRVTDSQIELARVALEAGDFDTAAAESQSAIIACQREQRPSEEARATAVLAQALLARDHLGPAREAADGTTRLAEASEQLAVKMAAAIAAARVRAATGEHAGALATLADAEETSRSAGYAGWHLEAQLAAAEVAHRAGREAEAAERLRAVRDSAEARGLGLWARKAGQLSP